MNLFLLVSTFVLWGIVLFLGFLLLGMLRALGLLRWRLEQMEATLPTLLGRSGLKLGRKAPAFSLPSVEGGARALADFAGRKVLLAFLKTGCTPCRGIAPALNELQRGGQIQVLVVHR